MVDEKKLALKTFDQDSYNQIIQKSPLSVFLMRNNMSRRFSFANTTEEAFFPTLITIKQRSWVISLYCVHRLGFYKSNTTKKLPEVVEKKSDFNFELGCS